MEQVKIAHVTTVSISLTSLLLSQLQSLQRVGYEIVGISSHGPEVPVIESASIRHVPVSITRNITPLVDIRSLWQLYNIFRQENFTIVHTHTPKPGLLGQLAARMARVPIVINTLHGFYFHENMEPRQRRFYIEMEKIAALCSDIILSQNKEDIQTALQEGICPPKKIKHLGNGIDLARFNPDQVSSIDLQQKRAQLGIAENTPVVGFVGRLAARRKGFIDFMAAAQQIVKRLPNIRFLIVGASDYGKPDSIQPSIAHDFGIAEHCLFVGSRPNAELPLFYKLMNVLVLPSLFEGIPRAVMEASAMGVPVVATHVKGNREAVEHGYNGLLVPLGDVQSLVDAIIELLVNPKCARQMGKEGHRIALERFDERLVFEKVKAEYAHLLHEKGFPVPEPSVTGLSTYRFTD